MPNELNQIHYNNPPLRESVLGVQFAEISKLSASHLGWYWRECLGTEWSIARDAPLLPEVTETFDVRPPEKAPLQFQPYFGPNRSQFIRNDNERVIQIQPTRFLYNWRREAEDYPHYEQLLPEFIRLLKQFQNFIQTALESTLSMNLWEIVYVNHIPNGDNQLWQSLNDWHRIFPTLFAKGPPCPSLIQEGKKGSWKFQLPNQIGRLYIEISHALSFAENNESLELLVCQMTARGPLDDAGIESLIELFDKGHDALVSTFQDVSSPEAKEFWS